MYKVGMIGLGCPKNQVDAEIMLSALVKEGFEIVGDAENADIVIINTCGFIDNAKKEAIETILDVAELKKEGIIKGIVVTGCLAQRYKDEIISEMPEVDAVIGIGANGDIASVCKKVMEGEKVCSFPSKLQLPVDGDRILTTPSYYAYIKIAEGCSNCCSYCAIPSIRGKFRSRKMENIIEEAKSLAENGVKELIVVAQDTTKYGIDLYGELKLSALVKELCKIEGIEWIRLLYCYPESITDELIKTIAEEEKICNYIDIPLQHSEDEILFAMNRKSTKSEITALISKLRKAIPDIIIRTTFIVGFPGESEENFELLCNFVEDAEFDRYGCFAYSPEEGTPASKMPCQIDDEIKSHRATVLNDLQDRIFDKKQEKLLGKTMKAIVEGFSEKEMLYFGRTYMDSPEIDTLVILSTEDELTPGQFVDIKIIAADGCDLVGEVIGQDII